MTIEPGKNENTVSVHGISVDAIAKRIAAETDQLDEARETILEMTKDWRPWQRRQLFRGLFLYHSK